MPTARKVEDIRQSWRPTPEKVEMAVNAAIEAAHPSRIFIFGSWASGDSTNSKDLDLAVLFPDERRAELSELRREIAERLKSIPMNVDLIVASEGHAAEFISSVNSVYYKILRHGKLVYDSSRRRGVLARISAHSTPPWTPPLQ